MSSVVAALFAVDPCGLGGVALRGPCSPMRDEWLALLRKLLPEGTVQLRIPLNINDTALLGGLDLGATLGAGRPVVQLGLLARANGGVVTLAMAERVPLDTAARLTGVMDTQEVAIERDGLALKMPARLGLVVLDEGMNDDEQVATALLERVAFLVRLKPLHANDDVHAWNAEDIAQARTHLPSVNAPDDIVQALCAAALALGVYSLRAPLLALKAARCAAALDGVLEVTEEHAALAARLVFAPRATQLPQSVADESKEQKQEQEQQQEQQQEQEQEPDRDHNQTPVEKEAADQSAAQNPQSEETPTSNETDISNAEALADNVLEAARAAIPAGLLAALQTGQAARAKGQAAGRSGAVQKSQLRGRPRGARRGEPRSGARLNVMETLRAAAPWQKLRERQNPAFTDPTLFHPQFPDARQKRIHVRREDFHITRFKQQGQTTTLFVVDASGSSALNRLAEAKGAVELLLADCYVRRDRVAVLAFRGKSAELLLPPTRSLARAKRSLAGLPGGGGTPLATAIDAARELAGQISRRGETVVMVLLTDGRGNIARDGSPGREKATDDAIAAARQWRASNTTALLLDTSPKPQAAAEVLALEMGAAYVPLPYAGAQAVSRVVQLASMAAKQP